MALGWWIGTHSSLPFSAEPVGIKWRWHMEGLKRSHKVVKVFALDVVQAKLFKWVHEKNPEKKNPSKTVKYKQNGAGLWFPESKITGGLVCILGETLISTATRSLPPTPPGQYENITTPTPEKPSNWSCCLPWSPG